MKNPSLTITSIITSLLFICCSNSTTEKKLNLFITNIKKVNTINEKYPNAVFYSIDVDLVNNTDTTIHCKIMSCSWEDNFFFKNDSIGFQSKICDSNYPEDREILPSKKITYSGIIGISSKGLLSRNKNFEMGFILTNKKNFINRLHYNMFSKEKDEKSFYSKLETDEIVIWSEPFILN